MSDLPYASVKNKSDTVLQILNNAILRNLSAKNATHPNSLATVLFIGILKLSSNLEADKNGNYYTDSFGRC
jgi:hypothetical protein